MILDILSFSDSLQIGNVVKTAIKQSSKIPWFWDIFKIVITILGTQIAILFFQAIVRFYDSLRTLKMIDYWFSNFLDRISQQIVIMEDNLPVFKAMKEDYERPKKSITTMVYEFDTERFLDMDMKDIMKIYYKNKIIKKVPEDNDRIEDFTLIKPTKNERLIYRIHNQLLTIKAIKTSQEQYYENLGKEDESVFFEMDKACSDFILELQKFIVKYKNFTPLMGVLEMKVSKYNQGRLNPNVNARFHDSDFINEIVKYLHSNYMSLSKLDHYFNLMEQAEKVRLNLIQMIKQISKREWLDKSHAQFLFGARKDIIKNQIAFLRCPYILALHYNWQSKRKIKILESTINDGIKSMRNLMNVDRQRRKAETMA